MHFFNWVFVIPISLFFLVVIINVFCMIKTEKTVNLAGSLITDHELHEPASISLTIIAAVFFLTTIILYCVVWFRLKEKGQKHELKKLKIALKIADRATRVRILEKAGLCDKIQSVEDDKKEAPVEQVSTG